MNWVMGGNDMRTFRFVAGLLWVVAGFVGVATVSGCSSTTHQDPLHIHSSTKTTTKTTTETTTEESHPEHEHTGEVEDK